MLEGVAILNRVVRKGLLRAGCLSRFPQTPTGGGRRGFRDIWVRSILGKDSHALREEAARLVGEL